MRILFIDDNDDMRMMMGILLKRHGYEVKTAGAAEAALEMAPAWQPHIVVSDIGMPGLNGHELLRRLREDSRLAPFRAIALTGSGKKLDENLHDGFDHLLVKPVEIDHFVGVLQSLEAALAPEVMKRPAEEMPGMPDGELDRSRTETVETG